MTNKNNDNWTKINSICLFVDFYFLTCAHTVLQVPATTYIQCQFAIEINFSNFSIVVKLGLLTLIIGFRECPTFKIFQKIFYNKCPVSLDTSIITLLLNIFCI